jgi:hypothetical protein
MPHNFIEK